MQSPHTGHRKRLRSQYLKIGADNMEEHSLFELLLTYAIPQADTNIIAHQLLKVFGGVSEVFDAPLVELMKIDGIGERSAVLIKLIPELARIYLDDKNSPSGLLNSAQKVGEFLKYKFVGRTNEVVYLLCLDSKGKILYSDIIFTGSIDRAAIEIRTIVETALRVGATGVVIAHNHPQGFAIPSNGDIETTRRLSSALSAINLRLLDHIIVARDDYVSLAQSGIISDWFKV